MIVFEVVQVGGFLLLGIGPNLFANQNSSKLLFSLDVYLEPHVFCVAC